MQQQHKIRLIAIDLSQAYQHECPGINDKDSFLALIDGQFFAGTFSRQWYGWNFEGWTPNSIAGLQFDAPGWNSSDWQALWRIKRVT